MSTYAEELLEGFAEQLVDFGTSIKLEGGIVPVPVVAVGPEISLDTEGAGYQEKGSFNFEVRRTDATAAGLDENSRFQVAGTGPFYQVQPIENDPGSPLLYVSSRKVQ